MCFFRSKVAGNWKTSRGNLTLKQEYQMLSGTMNTGNVSAVISDAKMLGDQITFSAGGAKYSGKVNGNNMEGAYTSPGGNGTWTASR